MKDDPIIDRSPAQKRMRIEIMKLEARPLGYVLVKESVYNQLLRRLPRADRAEAMLETVR